MAGRVAPSAREATEGGSFLPPFNKEDGVFFRWAVILLATAFFLFHLYTAAFGTFISQLQRPLHLAFMSAAGFVLYPALKGKKRGSLDIVLALTAGCVFGYLASQSGPISIRATFVTPLSTFDQVIGTLAIFLVVEIVRRTVGFSLALVSGVFLLFTIAGPHLPDPLMHRGFSWLDIIDYQVFGLDGIFSIPLGIAATYIVLFIFLGTFMEACGVGDLIMDLGKALVGKSRGGPAKIACLSSALVGSISGSAAANVYATGTFTIPLMKKMGYPAPLAGAIEAIASTGGQIMPPVMGMAAFLMAELLGVSYLLILKAALIPALLYYTSLYFVLDFVAARTQVAGLEEEEIPPGRAIIPRLYLLAPLVLLVVVLVMGYTPFRAAFFALITMIGLSFVRKETWFTPLSFLYTLVTAARRTVIIAAACAAAGVVIGVITLTGIGLSLSSMIISLSGGYTLPALILIMLSSILLGMGTPTTVAYIIVVALGVPVMRQLGFATLPSHLFVFYFAVLSMITPPVAIAAYAAGEIARVDPMRTGFVALRTGVVSFLIPYAFLFNSALLAEGPWWWVILRTFTFVAGIAAFVGGITGWYGRKVSLVWRFFLPTSFFLITYPHTLSVSLGIVISLVPLVLSYKGKDTYFSKLLHL